MTNEPRLTRRSFKQSLAEATPRDWLVASGIVGLLLLLFWIGYFIGKSLA